MLIKHEHKNNHSSKHSSVELDYRIKPVLNEDDNNIYKTQNMNSPQEATSSGYANIV